MFILCCGFRGEGSKLGVSCPLKANRLMLLLNLSRNRLPYSCMAQTGFSVIAEGLAVSGRLTIVLILEVG